ncbi:BAG family molecular chaperone regulator 4-like [Abrus precatorius]|uniref:BAG family molecular chaperone regulator 4-like n=1 Tax=Abrus precatorius TaxID=3816 RepID=A0A8B8MLG4_ABRPR|nr:BAG family molecular chaperone regulator 4-like [Abrus precatorius]
MEVLLCMPCGFIPSVANAKRIFLISVANSSWSSSNFFHYRESAGCLSFPSLIRPSACQVICFAFSALQKRHLNLGISGKYHMTFASVVSFFRESVGFTCGSKNMLCLREDDSDMETAAIRVEQEDGIVNEGRCSDMEVAARRFDFVSHTSDCRELLHLPLSLSYCYVLPISLLTMKGSASKGAVNDGLKESIDWELRPGGMLVQKRQPIESSSTAMIKIKVSHGSYHHEITVPAQSTFGHLKVVLTSETGLEPKEQRLLFRGKEKEDEECLHMEGLKDMSKVILLEDPASKERKLEEMQKSEDILKACEAVSSVRTEVDKLYEKVVALETTVCGGTRIEDKEFVIMTELLMVQLLKLDSITADGEAKVQRRVEVRRVQSYVDTIDNLKARNSTTFSNAASANNPVSVITKWEAFESGVGSFKSQTPFPSSTVITQNWEHFE